MLAIVFVSLQMKIIKLESSDGRIFETDFETIQCAGTIRAMLEIFVEDAREDDTLSLPTIDGATLERVLRWVEHYRHRDHPRRGELTLPEWDAEFLGADQRVWHDLVGAATFLDIRGLAHVTALAIAIAVRNEPAEMCARHRCPIHCN